VTLSAGPAAAFEPADLYLLSTWLPTGQPGTVRIDPATGGSAVLGDLAAAGQGANHMTTYSRARGQAVILDTMANVLRVRVPSASRSTRRPLVSRTGAVRPPASASSVWSPTPVARSASSSPGGEP